MVRVGRSWVAVCGATIAVLVLGLVALFGTDDSTSPEGQSRPPSVQQSSRPCLAPGFVGQPALSGTALVAYLNPKGVAAAAAHGSHFIETTIPAGGCANPRTQSATSLSYSLIRGIRPGQIAFVWDQLMKSGYFDRITETDTSTF